MTLCEEWDQTTNFPGCGAIKVPYRFDTMTGVHCNSWKMNIWGHADYCARNENHTGRHFAADRSYKYVIAVWK